MKSNILFIDDDKNVLEGYLQILRSKKSQPSLADDVFSLESETKDEEDVFPFEYKLFTANQGKAGAKIVEDQLNAGDPINVAFIDMRMPPGIDGAETAKLIREIDPKVEIVIVTAFSDKGIGDILRKVGRADKLLYLKKPFDPIEIKQLALNLSEKYRLEQNKRDFVANVTHELSTPLASVIGFLDLALDDQDMSQNVRECIEVSHRNSQLLKQLVQDLIMVASIQQGKLRYNFTQTSANELVTDAAKTISLLRENASKTEIEVCYDFLEEDQMLYCDPLRMKQVLLNLSYNALKFTTEGTIRLSVSTEGDQISFSVSDTGSGIAEDKQLAIFDRFVRIEDEHHGIPGLGLGLSIVSEIVKEHKGEIKLESKLGEGSTFTVTLKAGRPS